MHQRDAALGQRAELEDVEEDREQHLGQRRGLLVGQVGGHVQRAAGVDHRLLRVAAAREERHRALAHRPAAHLGADLRHAAGALEAEGRRGARGRRVEALALHQVRAVHARGAHADAELARTAGRGRHLAHAEHRLVARLIEDHRPHAAHGTRAGRGGPTMLCEMPPLALLVPLGPVVVLCFFYLRRIAEGHGAAQWAWAWAALWCSGALLAIGGTPVTAVANACGAMFMAFTLAGAIEFRGGGPRAG